MKKWKWLRRIGLVLAVVLAVVAIAVFALHRQASRVPEWYAQAKAVQDDPALESKTVIPLQNWASQVSSGDVAAKPAEQKRTTVVLTADQINGLIAKWTSSMGIQDRMSDYVKDLRVRLADGKITIAGEAVEYGRVISVVLEPRQAVDGNARLVLDAIRVGDATLPLVALNKQQAQLNDTLARRASAMKDRLSIDDRGLATRQTGDIYYTSLLTRLLSGQEADAFAFLGTAQDRGESPVATRIKQMKVDDGKLTLTLEVLSAAERESLVADLKQTAEPAAKPQ